MNKGKEEEPRPLGPGYVSGYFRHVLVLLCVGHSSSTSCGLLLSSSST